MDVFKMSNVNICLVEQLSGDAICVKCVRDADITSIENMEPI